MRWQWHVGWHAKLVVQVMSGWEIVAFSTYASNLEQNV